MCGNLGEALEKIRRNRRGEPPLRQTQWREKPMPAWHWTRIGPTAGGRAGAVGVGAVTVQDTPGAYRRPYVFVLDVEGNLWINWYDGTAWQVPNRGTPGVALRTPVGAITVQDSSVMAQ